MVEVPTYLWSLTGSLAGTILMWYSTAEMLWVLIFRHHSQRDLYRPRSHIQNGKTHLSRNSGWIVFHCAYLERESSACSCIQVIPRWSSWLQSHSSRSLPTTLRLNQRDRWILVISEIWSSWSPANYRNASVSLDNFCKHVHFISLYTSILYPWV